MVETMQDAPSVGLAAPQVIPGDKTAGVPLAARIGGGVYTAYTPDGAKDLRYVGNTPSETFDGPPLAVLNLVGVS